MSKFKSDILKKYEKHLGRSSFPEFSIYYPKDSMAFDKSNLENLGAYSHVTIAEERAFIERVMNE